jgi:hypothetical protein
MSAGPEDLRAQRQELGRSLRSERIRVGLLQLELARTIRYSGWLLHGPATTLGVDLLPFAPFLDHFPNLEQPTDCRKRRSTVYFCRGKSLARAGSSAPGDYRPSIRASR